MPSKFFNSPQLSQTQTQQSAKTTETGVDKASNAKAAQADRSIEMLAGIAGSAASIATSITGKYQENIEAKNRLESGKEMASYQQKVDQEMSSIQNLEAFSREDMDRKVRDINESFMDRYADSPFRAQLKSDIEGLQGRILGQMLTGRDELHVQKVGDATSGKASSLGQQYAEGTLDEKSLANSINSLIDESMIAHQVPTSTELDLSDEARSKYQSLTKKQSIDSIIKGMMVQVGQPENSKVADFLASKGFRESMGISESDEEYNKVVAFAKKKGEKADKFKYTQDLVGLKESLYESTNLGIGVDIDSKVKAYRDLGKDLTATDEHKLRKEFKTENSLLANSDSYVSKLTEGIDTTASMTNKEKESIYNRSFTNVLDITETGASIGSISGALGIAANQQSFKDYIQSGGKIPKDVIGLFDVPAGAGVDKWDEANAAITSMEVASAGSGYSIESLIGVNQVSKIRGLSRLLNDDQLDEATKKNAIEAFHTRSATFNSKGYLQGTDNTKPNTEWLDDVSRDARWTTDDYVSSQQNADEIAGNYQAYRLAGHDENTAQDMALNLFENSNIGFEMSNGGEIIIPRKHELINAESIVAFSKVATRFPSIQEQREDIQLLTGEGWISEWRVDTNVSIQKSYNFAKTGKYDMLFDGKLVKDSSFTYEEMTEFIGNTDHKTREKITGVKVERPFNEVEGEALENRKKRIKEKLSSSEDLLFNPGFIR